MTDPQGQGRPADPSISPEEGHVPEPAPQASEEASTFPGSFPEIPGVQISRKLGTGPRGVVYEGDDGQRTLAVKVFEKGVQLDEATLKQFLRGSTRRLRHPSLVPVEAQGLTAEGCVYLAMPLLVGDSLQIVLDDLKRGSTDRPSLSPLSIGAAGEVHPELPWCAAELFASAADGLAKAHAEGLVHGRVTPGNLHLSPAGRLLISDFGGAGPANRRKLDGLRFRPPEELGSSPESPAPTSDVYALGAILYEVVSRQEAFQGASPKELTRAITTFSLTPPSEIRGEVPLELEACILKAMARNPVDRYPSAAELAEDLKRFLRREAPSALTESVEANPLARGDVSSKQQRRKPAAVRSSGANGRAFGGSGRATPRRRKSLWWRAAAALVLVTCLVGAIEGGKKMRRDSRIRQNENSVVSLLQEGEYREALAETERFQSLNPGNKTNLLLADYASTAGALNALQEALGASASVNLPHDAVTSVTEASKFRPADSGLQNLATTLVDLSKLDPLSRELDDPKPLARSVALERLSREIGAGLRPKDDARLAVRALDPSQPAVTRTAIETLRFLEETQALIEGLHLTPGGPLVTLDSATFRMVYDTLQAKLDAPAVALLCEWDLDDCTALDKSPRPSVVFLRPNLRVELGPNAPEGFRARWIRTMSRIDSRRLLCSTSRLAMDGALGQDLALALEAIGSPAAQSALELLAKNHYLTAGSFALKALARLGRYMPLLEIVKGDLPLPYRELSLRILGEEFRALCLDELARVSRRSPDPSLRKLAFHYLCLEESAAAVAAIPPALVDPALKPMALERLLRLSPDLAGPVSVRLLEHPDSEVRSHATVVLASRKQGSDLVPVALRMLSDNAETRAAAHSVLVWKDELASFPQVLTLLLSNMQGGGAHPH